MKSKLLIACLLFAAALSASAQGPQPWAKERLEKSPRHGEWVDVANGSRKIHCFVVYPEVKEPAMTVIVIHEIFGMTDWVRSVTDQLAEAGYIAIAPDLLSGMGPNGGGSSDFKSGDDVRNAIFGLSNERVDSDLDAVAGYAKALPSANKKLAVAGFCWGGQRSFNYACHNPDLKGAFVFYGNPPSTNEMAKIPCPVYGFYGEKDNRVTSTVAPTVKQMKDAGKTYEPSTYPGAQHGFMRAGEDPAGNDANKAARDKAWERLKALLSNL